MSRIFIRTGFKVIAIIQAFNFNSFQIAYHLPVILISSGKGDCITMGRSAIKYVCPNVIPDTFTSLHLRIGG